MNLGDRCHFRRDGRDDGALEGPGGDYHIGGFDQAVRRINGETRATDSALDLAHLHPGANRRIEFAGIGFEVLGHLVLGGKGIGIQAGEFEPGKSVMPGRAVGDQRIPARRAPGLGDAVALDHQVRHALAAQMFTHGDAGLAGAYYKRIDA